MDTRIAIIGIIIENMEATAVINEILHEFAGYIIGRMGIPYHQKELNIISVVLDAPSDVINSLAGKVGRVSGVSARAFYSRK